MSPFELPVAGATVVGVGRHGAENGALPPPLNPRGPGVVPLALALLSTALILGPRGIAQAQGLGLQWGRGTRVALGEEGSLRLTGFARPWFRLAEPNPRTELGEATGDDLAVDAGLREARLLLLAAPLPELTIALGAGALDLGPDGGGTLGLTDAWVDAEVVPGLHLGAGLHPFAGLLREASVGDQAPLGLEPLGLARPFREATTDAFDRRLGAFVHGAAGPVVYRLAGNRAFRPERDREDRLPGAARLAEDGQPWWLEGRLAFRPTGPEPDVTPYVPGSWLGTAQVIELGVGGALHPNGALREAPGTEETSRSDVWLVAVDAFVDQPLAGGAALTAYAAYLYEDLGPDALRFQGALDRGQGGVLPSGPGFGALVAGTGHHTALTLGVVLPGRVLGTRFQPWVKATVSVVEAVDDPVPGAEAGVTWLVLEPFLRLDLAWRMRGTVDATGGMGTPPSARVRGYAHAGVLQLIASF